MRAAAPPPNRATLAAHWRRPLERVRRGMASASTAAARANIKEALASLRLNPQRSLLAVIGIVLGVASVTAMVSVGVAARAEARERFRALGTETLVVRKQGGSLPFADKDILAEDVALLPGRTASIAAAAPLLQVYGTAAYAGRNLRSNAMLGVTRSLQPLGQLSVRRGRFISDLDVNRPFCVLGAEVANEMTEQSGRADLVGESLSLAGRLYTVVGVLERSATSSLLPFRANESVLMPLSSAQRAFAGAQIQAVVVDMEAGANVQAAITEVSAYFRDRGVGVRVTSAEQLVGALQQQMRLFTLLLAAVGGIALVVGGASAMNVMLAAVTERRREVGIRRALGAKRGAIRSQFLTEAVVLSLLGGIVGIVLGTVVPFGISLYAGWALAISPTAMALGFLVASSVGVFFGAYPASRAASLDPITALRAE